MSQEAGYAIMGRMALFNQKWDDAIEAYNNVIGKVSSFKYLEMVLIMKPISEI